MRRCAMQRFWLTTTQLGLVIHEVDVERNLLLVKGSVPGPKSGIVEIREAK